jgi:hypothetical protein
MKMFSSVRHAFRYRATAVALLVVGVICLATQRAEAQALVPGSIQGHVAALVQSPSAAATRTSLIFVSGIDVWARAEKSGQTSPHVPTNAEGYFRTPELAPGRYQICAAGKGYVTVCDDHTTTVGQHSAVLNHIVEIRPSGRVMLGTVWLADRITPCFWFRAAMNSTPLTAQVSLQDSSGKVLAGPVSANASGQYVLPIGELSTPGILRAVCEAAVGEVATRLANTTANQDIAVPNHAPIILSFDLTKGPIGIRRADPGATVQATVQASDLDNDTLHYQWLDDSGRALGLPDAPTVNWTLLNAAALNTLHVQVTDGRGGYATAWRTLQTGRDEVLFTGHVFDRQTLANIAGATVRVNNASSLSDGRGSFKVTVADSPQFVLNVTKPGFALHSQVLRTLAINIPVPLDAVRIVSVNGGTGGPIRVPKGSGGGCTCECETHGAGDPGDRDGDKDDKERQRRDHDGGTRGGCTAAQAAGSLNLKFPTDAFVSANGAPFKGTVSVEAFQYDLSQTNPIPGDFGATYHGKPVRLGSFGAFHILPRDTAGHALAMASGKTASISLPIQPAQLSVAPSTIPFFSYDEKAGLWVEEGTLSRSGNRYVGDIKHFSAFNADTQFGGGACVKVVLDSSFNLPVTLDASYFDPTVGAFNHNGTTSADPIIGVERMRPNQNFTLTITSTPLPPPQTTPPPVSVVLYSGPGLDPVQFPGGLDTDQVNFSHCNGPVQVYNNTIPAPVGSRPYFLGPVFSPGTPITDNSAQYQAATIAGTGKPRNTVNGWKQQNGFHTDGTLVPGEATAIYFNNGDLKFGRAMHCRQTNTTTHATACYVSNFGAVGTDDATTALPQAQQWETAGQPLSSPTVPLPAATVAMEYDPVNGVQFFAYKTDGSYLAQPVLDSESAKPMPDMCMACHQGAYNGGTNVNNGSNFLPFDLSSFLDAAGNPISSSISSAAQEQFRQLNSMIAATTPPTGVSELITLWYPGNVNTTGQLFNFNQGAAQLPSTPFAGHEPLYNTVVAPVCRTCHTSIPGIEWNAFSQMSPSFIQSFACGPNYLIMPHAEVPWVRFWQQSLSSTLASELNMTGSGCPNH